MDENKLAEEKKFIESLHFTKQARYRCEQLNVSKVDGNLTGNGKQKFQYLMSLGANNKFGKVKLEEHYYDFAPAVLNKSFEMISANEKIKNNDVVFAINENGLFDRVLNRLHLKKDWIDFRDGDFQELEFVKILRENNQDVYQELISSGNKQFSEDYDIALEYQTNLFYLTLFDNHLMNENSADFPEKEFKFTSLLFPEIFIPLKMITTVSEEDANTISLKRESEMMLDKELETKIENSYRELYQSAIQFGFSEYRLVFNIDLKYDKYTKIAEIAECYIEEEVLNNLENMCSYNIKRVKT